MSTPALTEEQRERTRRNRERALSIQRRKRREREEAAAARAETGDEKRRRATKEREGTENDGDGDEKDVEFEDFEVGASEHVSKREAKETYCLPEGTLAVCEVKERDNPHQKKWNPMKLYKRVEVRRRARERYGGLEGLVAEREKRMRKRFEKDLEVTKDIFK